MFEVIKLMFPIFSNFFDVMLIINKLQFETQYIQNYKANIFNIIEVRYYPYNTSFTHLERINLKLSSNQFRTINLLLINSFDYLHCRKYLCQLS